MEVVAEDILEHDQGGSRGNRRSDINKDALRIIPKRVWNMVMV